MTKRITIGDVCDFVGGSQPPKSTFKYNPEGGYVRLIQTRDYKSNNFLTYIPEKSTKKFCTKSDIMIGRYGPPIFQIGRGLEGAYNVALMKAVPKENISNEYLYYFLKQKSVFEYVDQLSIRTGGQTGVDLQCLRQFPLLLPPPEDQSRISSVLSTLDAKIALNHRINGELEGLAKLLYDYWFVQYDFPLSAAQAAALGKPKLAGQPYRTSGGKMLFNPTLKREIPEGWTCATLGELFNLYQPQTITDKDLKPDGDYFVYGANGIVGKYDRFNHEKPQIALTCRGSTCGNLTRTLPRSWITGNAMVMAPRDPNLDIEYIFNVANASGIGAIITGSGQPQITRANLQGVKTISPDPDTLARYQGFAHPISKHRISLEQQNQELTTLRDWLLPMLMNGQVTVS